MTHAPHDALFKITFSKLDHARAALKSGLPAEVADAIDFSSLQQVPGIFIDQRFAQTQSDMLFSANYRGTLVLLYLLAEHKSEPDRFTPIQLLGYVSRIFEGYLANNPRTKTLPGVICFVFHHGQPKWNYPRSLQGLLAPELQDCAPLMRWFPNLEFILDDIGRATNAELMARPMPVSLRFTFWAFRDSRSSELLHQLEHFWAVVANRAYEDPDDEETIIGVMSYILAVRADITVAQLRNAVRQAGPKVEASIMTAAERLIEQGELKGEARGEARGELNGRRDQLRKMLTRKFGTLDAFTDQRLSSATLEDLDLWADRILFAPSISAVFQG